MIILKLIIESLLFALNALRVNKVRTVLSLLGITIGIFSIISVFTIFDSLEGAIRSEINSLGSNVLFVQKWPWHGGGEEIPWWKYLKRPEPKFKEMVELQKRSNTIEASTFMVNVRRDVSRHGKTVRGSNTMERLPIVSVSHDYKDVMKFDLQAGRYFTHLESHNGRNLAIIGADIDENLFPGEDPIGKEIKVFGRKMTVIGVMVKEGESVFGQSRDNYVIIPVNFATNVLDMHDIGSLIIVKAKPHISNDQMRDEITGIMRSIRKLPPKADDDFAINETDIITKAFDALFAVIATVGWIIGGFSLLVGGFGIANIMFVSVKERTGQIGIQKSLGAKRYFILLQFLFEAVFLSIIGGFVGLFIVFILTLVSGALFNFELILTFRNIAIGVGVSALIGLISGFVPSWSASRLDPVEAMRSSF